MMKLQLEIKKAHLAFLPAFLILYAFGGAIQLTNLLSQTSTNVIVILILFLFIIRNRRIYVDTPELVLLLALASLLIGGIINGSGGAAIGVYLYYFSCIAISFYSAKLLANHPPISTKRAFSIAGFILTIQIPTLIFQAAYAEEIAAVSRTAIIPLDVLSGTFYLKSDASLAFTALTLSSATFLLKARHRYLILIASIAIAFLTNSKASQAAALIVFIALVMRELALHNRIKKTHSILLRFSALFIGLSASIFYLDAFKFFLDWILTELSLAYETRFNYETANRLAVLGELLFGDLSLFGSGFLTYYNPLENSWLYYSGHSLFYSLVIDCGIIGAVVFLVGIAFFTWKKIEHLFFRAIFLFIFLTFSFFNFSASDISFLISYFFFIYLAKARADATSRVIYIGHKRRPG